MAEETAEAGSDPVTQADSAAAAGSDAGAERARPQRTAVPAANSHPVAAHCANQTPTPFSPILPSLLGVIILSFFNNQDAPSRVTV